MVRFNAFKLVGFAVRAQDFLVKQGLNKEEALEVIGNNSLYGTTNASNDFNPSRYHTISK